MMKGKIMGKSEIRVPADPRPAWLRALLLACLVFTLLQPGDLAAQTISSDDIVRALLPKNAEPTVRSFRRQAPEPHPYRGISIEGELPPEVELPRINLTVNFEFDSASLTNDGILTLQALGVALQDPRLKAMRFQVAGHTDLRGSAYYNQQLSQRRAQTVAEFLATFYGIPRHQLFAVGYGENRPVDPYNPASGLNRRVEIINVQPLS